jgi:hypothetical protein
MPISEKEHFDALRSADQRAVELLASANANRTRTELVVGSILVSLLAVMLTIASLILHGKCQ